MWENADKENAEFSQLPCPHTPEQYRNTRVVGVDCCIARGIYLHGNDVDDVFSIPKEP
jgi:hypothetical protein